MDPSRDRALARIQPAADLAIGQLLLAEQQQRQAVLRRQRANRVQRLVAAGVALRRGTGVRDDIHVLHGDGALVTAFAAAAARELGMHVRGDAEAPAPLKLVVPPAVAFALAVAYSD